MRRFSLFKRGKVFYVQFLNPDTNNMTTAKSTGAKTKNEAAVVVADWLRHGIPAKGQKPPRPLADKLTVDTILAGIRKAALGPDDVSRIVEALKERGLLETAILKGGPGSPFFTDFLLNFWDFDQSPFIKEKLAHGHSIGRRHCYESTMKVKGRWAQAFEGKRLAEVTRQDLKAFSLALSDDELSPTSINRILEAGTTALRWAFKNELLPLDPTAGLVRFSGPARKRGILTPDEASKLFLVEWKEERARVGNLLAMTTGMRAGEVLALGRKDIGDDRLFIRHSWSEDDRLKAPKTGVERIVHLLPAVRAALLALWESNPHSGKEFVFYSVLPDRPMDIHFLLNGYKEALGKIGISEEVRSKRNLVFHSWRHYFSTVMADRVGERAMKLTGHMTNTVFETYANHASEKEFKALEEATGEAFGNVIPFKRAASE